jgi:NhaA family Na+:H+ antiporter
VSMYSDRDYHDRATRILDRYDFDSAAPRGTERVDHDALALSAIAKESVPPLNRIEEALHPWSSFVVVPIFALANAGVRFAGVDLGEAARHPVSLGVGIGLLVGKFVGISAFAWAAVRLGIGALPRFTGWRHVLGLAAIAGIGFTVALFVTALAFDDPFLTDRAKTGIFIGSTLAGLVGYMLLRTTQPLGAPRKQHADAPPGPGT